MSLRETMNKNPGITTGVTAGIIVLALLFIIWSNWAPSAAGEGSGGKSFFSDDDGVTWFPDDSTKIPPFTGKNGKEAYRAYVFQCKGGKPFVWYLERYTKDAQAKLEANRSKKSPDIGLLESINFQGLEVKKAKAPTEKWIKQSAPNYAQVVQPKCPDGDPSQIISVMPE